MALWDLVLSSLRTRSWRVSDSAGAASWRSRIFCIGLWSACLRGRLRREAPSEGWRRYGKERRTLMLPSMSFLTGEKATEPRTSGRGDEVHGQSSRSNVTPGRLLWMLLPNIVVKASAASRKSEVAMALSLAASTGTSTNDFLKVSR